jgi:hypothetical protein
MQDNSKCTIDLTIQQLTTIVTGYSRQLLANYCDPINVVNIKLIKCNNTPAYLLASTWVILFFTVIELTVTLTLTSSKN